MGRWGIKQLSGQRLPERLLVLGVGWANYSLLRGLNPELYKVAVVSPRNHFLFTPLLTSTTVGTLEFRSIVEPIRNLGFEQARDLHLSKASAIDFVNRRVTCKSTLTDSQYDVEYDKLIVGVGALSNTFSVPGVWEHCFFLKELSDARAIRTRLLDNFEKTLEPTMVDEAERSRLKHIVIVGGGPTGVEFGAELYDFCQHDLTRLYKAFGAPPKVTLIESRKILGSFDQRLQAYAEKKLEQRENFKLVKGTVTEVKPDRVILDDGSELPCGLVVWSTGLAPQPLVAQLAVEKNRQGQILTDRNLNILSDSSGCSYAIGDCAEIRDVPLPCTAQVAERQGSYLADRLNRLAQGKAETVSPFEFKSLGMLAYIGGNQALADLPEFKMKGIPSWLLWRSAYLTRLSSWRLRLQVPLDWLKTSIFGRDTSRF